MDSTDKGFTIWLTSVVAAVAFLVFVGILSGLQETRMRHETCYQSFEYNEAHRILYPTKNYCGEISVRTSVKGGGESEVN